jgi:hypothetical protein
MFFPILSTGSNPGQKKQLAPEITCKRMAGSLILDVINRSGEEVLGQRDKLE